MKVAVAGFADETCTFCQEPTTEERFEPATLRGEEILEQNRGIPNYINGFIRAAEEEEVELVPLVYSRKTPGGFQSWLTTECFDKYANEIALRLESAGEIDGVLLALHGAMAVTGVPRPEAEIARRARRAVGDGVPIMVTLDLHANEDEALAEYVDGVFVIKTYPHVDTQETGEMAARTLFSAIRGDVAPVVACSRPGIVSASIFQATEYHPMKDILARCSEWEESEEDLLYLAVAPGYAYADVPDIGMSVWAVADGDRELAQRAAAEVADYAWSLREALARDLPKPREAVAEVMDMVSRGERPVVIADGADRIGDTTHVLRELLRAGAENWAIPGIADPKAARYLEENASEGDEVTLSVGGWYDESSGDPVEVTGVVEFMGRPVYKLVGPMGRGSTVRDGFVARLNLGDNRQLVISERMRGANDSAGLTSVGIDVDSLDIIVLKDRVHHRAYWDTVGAIDYPINAPGIGYADLRMLEYENVPSGTFPINCDG
ncbi:MAG: M81 family metallopeptidase [Clostridia bacterium]